MTEGVAAPRDIQTRMFDSSRWNHVKLRDDDIIVATWAKSGTTLTQQMVAQLVSGGEDDGVAAMSSSPWVDVRFMMPLDALAAMLEAQTHRRCLKTHLPFEALPYSESVKYVYIGRDARDVLVERL
jgi:aryl sulfotransferase